MNAGEKSHSWAGGGNFRVVRTSNTSSVPGIALNRRPRTPVGGCVRPEPQNAALFGGATADAISKGSVDESIWRRWAWSPGCALVRGGRTPRGEDGRRERRDAATAKDGWRSEAGREGQGPLPGPEGGYGAADTEISDLWLQELGENTSRLFQDTDSAVNGHGSHRKQ